MFNEFRVSFEEDGKVLGMDGWMAGMAAQLKMATTVNLGDAYSTMIILNDVKNKRKRC